MTTRHPHTSKPAGHFSVTWLIVMFAVLFLAPNLRADTFSVDFDQANKLYEEGKYAAAIAGYNKLLETGSSEGLYFNRGNAFFKLGQVGRAVASYRQAELLAPRDADVRANLQFARAQARGGTTFQSEPVRRLLGALTLNGWSLLTSGIGCFFFLSLGLKQWRRDSSGRIWLLASGSALILSALALGTALHNDYFTSTAIVVVGESDVRIGPLDESASAFKVRDGVELSITDRKDDWLQVADSSQRTGWIRQNQVLVLVPANAANLKL